nr:MAG TPA: hypothetical protein [Caudoviricetes sp.]
MNSKCQDMILLYSLFCCPFNGFLFVLYIVVTFLYMPFVPVYKDFIWIIQLYRSVSPSDFHRALVNV